MLVSQYSFCQVGHVKRVCNNLANEVEQLRALRKSAYATVARDEAYIAAIGPLKSLEVRHFCECSEGSNTYREADNMTG
jgi:hypothetical protein